MPNIVSVPCPSWNILQNYVPDEREMPISILILVEDILLLLLLGLGGRLSLGHGGQLLETWSGQWHSRRLIATLRSPFKARQSRVENDLQGLLRRHGHILRLCCSLRRFVELTAVRCILVWMCDVFSIDPISLLYATGRVRNLEYSSARGVEAIGVYQLHNIWEVCGLEALVRIC